MVALRSEFVTRGHPYEIPKRHCSCTARSSLFFWASQAAR